MTEDTLFKVPLKWKKMGFIDNNKYEKLYSESINENIDFDNFDMTFIVDEQLKNYMEIL